VNVVATRLGTQQEASTVRTVTRRRSGGFRARSVPEVLQAPFPGSTSAGEAPRGCRRTSDPRGGARRDSRPRRREPVSDAQTNHHGMDLDLPLDAVERIEVLYGAASALYGADAWAASSISSRAAPLSGGPGPRSRRAGSRYGSLDTGAAGIATKLGDLVSVAVDGGRCESSGFRDDHGVRVNTLRALPGRHGIGPANLVLGLRRRSFGAYSFYGTRGRQQETTRTRTARLSASLAVPGWTISPSPPSARSATTSSRPEQPGLYENLHDTTGRRSASRPVTRSRRRPSPSGPEAGPRHDLFHEPRGPRAQATRPSSSSSAGRSRCPHPREADSGPVCAGTGYDGFDSRLSPQLAAWVLWRRDFPPGIGGDGVPVPTFTDLYYQDPQNRGNADLLPERAVNVEQGSARLWGLSRWMPPLGAGAAT